MTLRLALLLLVSALGLARSAEAQARVEVAIASSVETDVACRALDAELRSIGVTTVALPLGESNASVERSARSSGAAAVVLCRAEPSRFVVRVLDGSWPTDPAFVIAWTDADLEEAVVSTSEWLRNHFVAAAAATPPPPPPPPPPLEWQRPYLFAGAVHDEVIDYDFLRPFIAIGAGFFPMRGFHLLVQLTVQPYRIERRTATGTYRVATDNLAVGAGYLHTIGRGHFGLVGEGRIGVVRARADGENVVGTDERSDVAWNPVGEIGGGFWARTRSIVAFRLIGAFRTYFRDTVLSWRGERLATIQAHNWLVQWQVEVGL